MKLTNYRASKNIISLFIDNMINIDKNSDESLKILEINNFYFLIKCVSEFIRIFL